MARDDWLRNDRWNEKERELFFSRLKRARSAYTKIQLYIQPKVNFLLRSKKREKYEAACELLEYAVKNLDEKKTDWLMIAVLRDLGACYARLEIFDKAEQSLEEAYTRQKKANGFSAQVERTYAEVIVKAGKLEKFDLAFQLLEEFRKRDGLVFHSDAFAYHALRAIMFAEKGQNTKASVEAQEAWPHIRATHSGMSYHPDVGLVKPDSWIVQEFKKRFPDPKSLKEKIKGILMNWRP